MEMQVRLNDNMRQQLTDIIELHKGYFGGDVEHLLDALKGVKASRYIGQEAKEIILNIEQATGIAYSELKSKNRERNTVIARQYAMFQLYDILYPLGYTLTEIGKMFNRDHSTVIYSIRQVEDALSAGDFLITKIHENYGKLEAKSA